MISRRFSVREKRILVLCVVVLFVYVNYQFVFLPLKARRQDLQLEIAGRERELRKQMKTVKKGRFFDGQYQEALQKFRQKGSQEQEMSTILSEIEQVANQGNLSIVKMTPQKVRREDFYNNFSVSLSLNGLLEDILKFFYVLQTAPHLFDVESLRVEKLSVRIPQLRCQLIVSKSLLP